VRSGYREKYLALLLPIDTVVLDYGVVGTIQRDGKEEGKNRRSGEGI
jgi:hypothetical protein